MPPSSGLAPPSHDLSAGSRMDRSPRDRDVEEEIARKELESQLVEVGDMLASPPSDIEELLSLLDQAKSLLVRVGQSPLQSMRTALFPIMKALVAKELLSHPHIDVRVSLASCFSELTRITAPTDPYGENFLKDIFQLIVGAFKNLDDMSSRSYSKRVSILQTTAAVRSFNLMLDFEFDDLIIEMFEHFLKAISSSHPQNIYSSMETIMTSTINETGDNIAEILCLLLRYVKSRVKSGKDNSPIAYSLAEKVIGNCSRKLKPYLVEFMQKGDFTWSDYSDVVASICQHNPNTSEFKGIYTSGDCLANGSMLSEKIIPDKLPQVSECARPEPGSSEIIDTVAVGSSVSAVCNGTLTNGNGDFILGTNSPKKKLNATAVITDCDELGSSQPIGLGGVAGHYKGSKINKTNSLIQLEDATCHFQPCSKRPSRKSSRIKGGTGFQSDIQINKEAGACLLKETERRPETDPFVDPDNEAVLITLPTTHTNAPLAVHHKKQSLSKKKITGGEHGTGQTVQNPSSVFGSNGDSDGGQNAKEPLSSEAINAEEDEFISKFADKSLSHAGKVALLKDTELGESPFPSIPSSKKCGVIIDSGRKILPQTSRRSTRKSANREASEKQKPDKFPPKKESITYDEPADPSLKDRFSTRRISNSQDRSQYHLYGSDRRSSARKRARSDEANGSMLSEKIIPDKLPQVSECAGPEPGSSEIIDSVAVGSSVSAVCNGTLTNGDGDFILGTNSPKKKLNATAVINDCDELGSSQPIGLGGVAGHYKGSKINKTNSLIQFEDSTCHSQPCNKRPSRRSSRIKEGTGFQSDIQINKEAGACLLKETERRPEADPSVDPDNEAVLITLPTNVEAPSSTCTGSKASGSIQIEENEGGNGGFSGQKNKDKSIVGNSSKRLRVRGINKCKKVLELEKGKKINVKFFNNRVVNNCNFSRYIGKLVRSRSICPLNVHGWKDISEAQKEHMWACVKDKFQCEDEDIEIHRGDVLKHMKSLWKNFRADLYRHHVKDKFLQDAVRSAPPGVDENDWKWLVLEHFGGSQFQKNSIQNRKNRSKVTMPHRTGSKPFRDIIYEMGGKDGNPPPITTLFFEMRKKDDKLVDQSAMKKYDSE